MKVLPLDLSRQASVRAFVEAFRRGQFPPLVGIVCNAGLQNVGTPTKTEEGYETTFAVNHLGHYLLTRLLLPDLATNASITFVSSGTHDPKQKTGMPVPRYVTTEALAHDFEPGGTRVAAATPRPSSATFTAPMSMRAAWPVRRTRVCSHCASTHSILV